MKKNKDLTLKQVKKIIEDMPDKDRFKFKKAMSEILDKKGLSKDDRKGILKKGAKIKRRIFKRRKDGVKQSYIVGSSKMTSKKPNYMKKVNVGVWKNTQVFISEKKYKEEYSGRTIWRERKRDEDEMLYPLPAFEPEREIIIVEDGYNHYRRPIWVNQNTGSIIKIVPATWTNRWVAKLHLEGAFFGSELLVHRDFNFVHNKVIEHMKKYQKL